MTTQPLEQLLRDVDKAHADITPAIRNHLNGRDITNDIINRRKIGHVLCAKQGWISIPIPDAKGHWASMVLRAAPGAPKSQKRYMNVKGSKATLYPLDILMPDSEYIVICEGILDALAAESRGIAAVTGTAGVTTFPAEWLDSLPQKITVLLCFDNDEAGRKGTKKTAALITKLRPDIKLFVVELPPEHGKDLTDFLSAHPDATGPDVLMNLAKPISGQNDREKLIAGLRSAGPEPILPIQHFKDDIVYYAVELFFEGSSGMFFVTSGNDCFPCHEVHKKGFRLVRAPSAGVGARWPQAQLADFLEGRAAFSLRDAYEHIHAELVRYVEFSDPRHYICVALWALASYYYRFFPAFPYLHFTGPKNTGKSTALQILALLSFNGEHFTRSSSAASIVRLIHGSGITCCIDEAEKMWRSNDDYGATLQETLRTGYKKGVFVTKCERMEDGFIVVRFDPYSAKALASIDHLEDALASRCIEIVMHPAKTKRPDVQIEASVWQNIRGAIYPATLCGLAEVKRAKENPGLPPELHNRDRELWLPLLVMASAVDSTGGLHAKCLSLALEAQKRHEDQNEEGDHAIVLRCLWDQLGTREEAFIPAEDVFLWLHAEEDVQWASNFSKSRRGIRLNRILNQLGVWKGPAVARTIVGEKKKGYDIHRESLLFTAQRYDVHLVDS